MEPRTQSAHAPHNGGSFQSADDPADQRTSDNQRADTGNKEKSGAKQEAPEATSKSTKLTPALHPVAGIVVTHHVLFRVVVFADNRELLHVKPRFLEFPDRALGLGMGVVNGDATVFLCPDFILLFGLLIKGQYGLLPLLHPFDGLASNPEFGFYRE